MTLALPGTPEGVRQWSENISAFTGRLESYLPLGAIGPAWVHLLVVACGFAVLIAAAQRGKRLKAADVDDTSLLTEALVALGSLYVVATLTLAFVNLFARALLWLAAGA